MNRVISYLNVCIDYLICVLTVYFSLWLRFNGDIPQQYWNIFLYSVWFIALVKILVFFVFGVYQIIVNFIHTYDVLNIFKANLVATLAFSLINFIFQSTTHFLYPRSVVIIDFFLVFLFISSVRYIEKYILKPVVVVSKEKRKRVLVIGAGEAGSMVLRELRNHPEAGMRVIGFIDDNRSKLNMSIGGKKIFGSRYKIPDVVKKQAVNLIIIAMPSAPQQVISETVEICEKTEAKLKIVPSTYDIIAGDVKYEQIRDIKIEDLLGREEIKLNNRDIEEYIRDKVVLITGAGGSIGSEISRQVAHFHPKKIILLGKGENSIFNINFELNQKYVKLSAVPVICDVKDKIKLEKIFQEHKPHIVFHAAAHKHVYLMELFPAEAFENNIVGTWNLADLSVKYRVKKFVLISTDKAVNPTSVMGMTKRIAEKVIVGFMNKYKSTKFVAVRFGNVLGSRGSVVPIFKKQIAAGGPVTVTHPDVKRYFMTIPEAVQLVLEAGGVAQGGEIFILDMGEPVRIIDLAKKMIRLSGYIPEKEIKIKYIGLKPGEKLFEELVIDRENVNSTKYNKILIARPEKIKLNEILNRVSSIKLKINQYSKNSLKQLIKNLI